MVSTFTWAGDDIEQDEAQIMRKQGVILPLQEIIQSAQRLHNGRIIEVDLERKHNRYIYEIELVDDNGQVWEMKFDASNATLISQEQDD
jgi:uncharacterized membrane protein YkoI